MEQAKQVEQVEQVELTEDAEYLIGAMVGECRGREVSYAARIGIAAVILNRMEDERYPDSAAGVIGTWEAFAPVERTDGGRLAEDVEYAKEYRLCTDAYLTALSGSDPTCGATEFEFIDPDVVYAVPYPTVLIDSTIFWGRAAASSHRGG